MVCLAGNSEATEGQTWLMERVMLFFRTVEVVSDTLLRARVSLPWRAELLLEAIQRAGPGGAR